MLMFVYLALSVQGYVLAFLNFGPWMQSMNAFFQANPFWMVVIGIASTTMTIIALVMYKKVDDSFLSDEKWKKFLVTFLTIPNFTCILANWGYGVGLRILPLIHYSFVFAILIIFGPAIAYFVYGKIKDSRVRAE